MNNDRVIQALRNSDNWEEYHTNMGRLCGIPECCIKFFVSLDKAGIPCAVVMDQLYGKIINEPLDSTGGRYVLCPNCRRNRKIKKIPYKKPRSFGIKDFNEFKEDILVIERWAKDRKQNTNNEKKGN